MSKFGTSVVTEQGKALLFGDEKIIYTKAALFSQDLSETSVEDMRKLTGLTGKLFETPIGINKRGAGTVNIEASFSNKDLTDDIDFNSVGWFAKPDGGQEILVSVSPVNGTQTLGAMTPGQQATDAIDLVLATAVGDSSKVDVVIDPAGQVTAAKLNSIVENLKADYSKQGDDLTSKIEANKEATDKAIADNKASADSALKSATDKLTKTISDNQASTNAAIDKAKSDADSKISSLTDTVTANKNATDKEIASTNATVASNKTDTDKKIADVSSTVSANKTATDKAISDTNSAITANKKDADTKINNLNSTVASNKTATDKAISDLNSTVTANKKDADNKISSLNTTVANNKKATDSALTTKANTADVNKQIASINSAISTNNSSADSKINSLTTTVNNNKKDADNKISSLTNTVNTKADANKAFGSVNLLENSKGPFKPNGSKTDNYVVYSSSKIYLKQGTTYTIWAKTNGTFSGTHNASASSKNCVLWLVGNNVNNIVSSPTTGTTGTAFTWNSATGWYSLRVNSYVTDNSIQASEIKIVEGNFITKDWSPAPSDVENEISAKANASAVYDRSSIDNAFKQRDNSISTKADKSSTYTKNEVDSKVNAKANSSDVYTKSQVDSKTTTLQNGINNKADKSSVYSINQINQLAFQSINTATNINTFTTYGKYKMTSTSNTNTPPWISDHRGQLINLNYDDNAKTQIWIPVGSGAKGGDFGWRYWEGSSAPGWIRVSSYAELQNVQNTLQSKLDTTNKNVTTAQSTANTANSTANAAKSAAATAQSTANSATTKANNAQTTATNANNNANNRLSKVGTDNMAATAFINWNSNIANGKTGSLGGLSWAGATDSAKIYGSQTGTDNLDLAFDLGDDGSNHFSFRNKGSEVAAIQSNGHFTGTVDWSKVNGKPTDIGSTSAINSLKTQVNSVVSQVNNLDPNKWRQKGEVVDLNTFWDTGYYTLMNSNNKNLPSWINDKRGSLITLSYDGNSKTQIFISCLSSQIAYRTTVGSSRSSSWYRFATNSDIDNLQNQINQIKSTVPVVQKFTDENQAKTWSNAGGSQVRIAIID